MKRGWVLYDGECNFCIAIVKHLKKVLTPRGFNFAKLQEPWVTAKLGLDANQPLTEMALITENDTLLGGADAVIYLSRLIWWTWPLYFFSKIPFGKALLWKGYRWVAARRHCLSGNCRIDSKSI